ncbi:MAG: hypothetical protein B6D68_01625 [spirochete symbiont of Stewartia floridana]|nr:MAG: hypothetical protein B6D68_01625 [spirochete symbiont of Stewartia floridana]
MSRGAGSQNKALEQKARPEGCAQTVIIQGTSEELQFYIGRRKTHSYTIGTYGGILACLITAIGEINIPPGRFPAGIGNKHPSLTGEVGEFDRNDGIDILCRNGLD